MFLRMYISDVLITAMWNGLIIIIGLYNHHFFFNSFMCTQTQTWVKPVAISRGKVKLNAVARNDERFRFPIYLYVFLRKHFTVSSLVSHRTTSAISHQLVPSNLSPMNSLPFTSQCTTGNYIGRHRSCPRKRAIQNSTNSIINARGNISLLLEMFGFDIWAPKVFCFFFHSLTVKRISILKAIHHRLISVHKPLNN